MKTIRIKSLRGGSKVAVSNIAKWRESQLTPIEQLDLATQSYADCERHLAKIDCIAISLTAMAVYILALFVF